MKKLLLSLVSLMAVLSAAAGSFTVTFKSASTASDGSSPVSALSAIVEQPSYVDATGFTATNIYAGKQGYGTKFSTSSKNGILVLPLMTTPINAQVKVTSIVVTAAPWQTTGASKAIDAATLKVSLNDGTAVEQALDNSVFELKDYTFEFDGTVAAQSIKLEAVKRLYITKMVVNYDGADLPAPTAPEATKVASIAAFKAAKSNAEVADGKTGTEEFEFTCPLTVIYQSQFQNSDGTTSIGNNLYVTDGTENLLIYGVAPLAYTNGDVIPAGVKGNYKNSKGYPQLAVVAESLKAATAGTPVQPIETTVDDANGEGYAAYVKLMGVNVTSVTGKDFVIDNGVGATIAGYNNNNLDVVVANNLNITGFVSYYSNWQIIPVEIASASGKEIVAAPEFSPAGGMVAAGTLVTITSATEGATIYYTLDGSTPNGSGTTLSALTGSSMVYNAPIAVNADMTIKAIAVKAGMETSSVVSAEYTVLSDKYAVFNFADPTTLTPAYSPQGEGWKADGTTGNNYYAVNGVDFTVGNVTVVSPTPESGTYARLYYTGAEFSPVTFRVYNKTTLVVKSTDAANPVVEITVTFNNGSTSYDKVTAPAVGTWGALEGKDATWTGEAESVEFGAVGTLQINKIVVKCKSSLTESGVDNVLTDGSNAPVEFYNLQGVRVDNPTRGLYIRRQGNTATKVIL